MVLLKKSQNDINVVCFFQAAAILGTSWKEYTFAETHTEKTNISANKPIRQAAVLVLQPVARETMVSFSLAFPVVTFVAMCGCPFQNPAASLFVVLPEENERHNSAYQCQHDNQQSAFRESLHKWRLESFWFFIGTTGKFVLQWSPNTDRNVQWTQ